MSDVGQQVLRARAQRRMAAALLIVVLGILAIIYGPLLVSGNYHRAAIERLASDAVGRPVMIAGPIALSLFPDPQLRAKTITIGSPNGDLANADTLKLDLAPWPLLLGRLRATKLTLRKPTVALPWPLPGGARSIAPPPWLASLHATIVDGTFRIGRMQFDHVDLSIFTGGPNAVLAASGSVAIAGTPALVTLDIDNASGRTAPVRAAMTIAGPGPNGGRIAPAARLDFAGTLDHAGLLMGRLSGLVAKPGIGIKQASFQAQLAADGALIALRRIDVRSGTSRLTGRAAVALRPAPLIRLDLQIAHARLGPMAALLARLDALMPVAASLALTDLRHGMMRVPTARMLLAASPAGLAISTLTATLAGHGHLRFTGDTNPDGTMRGDFRIDAVDPRAALAGMLTDRPAWPHGLGRLTLTGRIVADRFHHVRLDNLSGGIGGTARRPASRFTGRLVMAPRKSGQYIAATLRFRRLVVDPHMLAALPDTMTGPFIVTAGRLLRAGQGAPVPVGTRLLIDGAIRSRQDGGGIAIRLASLRVGHALVVAHGTRLANGAIGAMGLMMTGPDAAAALAAGAAPPPWQRLGQSLGLFHHAFAVAIVAAGPAAALHAGITLHLGTLRVAATPVADLPAGRAVGGLTMHAPNAAHLLAALGGRRWLGRHQGLEWPGAGSASLRATAFTNGTSLGLTDFVLSFGALDAAGRLSVTRGPDPVAIAGAFAADTLPLPAPRLLFALADAALASDVSVTLPAATASQISRAGITLARQARFGITLAKQGKTPHLTITADHASVADGVLSGSLVLTGGAAPSQPTVALTAHLDHAAIAKLSGMASPFTAGSVTTGLNLTAHGGTPADWGRDLAGNLTMTGTGISLSGIDLAKAGAVLEAATKPGTGTASLLRQASTSGQTRFATANLAGAIGHGIMTLGQADLAGPSGTIGLAGTIDLVRRHLMLLATARPVVAGHKTAPPLPFLIGGTLAAPRVQPQPGPAMDWVGARRAAKATAPPERGGP